MFTFKPSNAAHYCNLLDVSNVTRFCNSLEALVYNRFASQQLR